MRLTFRGASTQPIAYDASSTDVKRALEALPTIGSVSITGDVFCVPPCATCGGPSTCSSDSDAHKACDVHGYPLNVGNFSIEFTSELGDVPPLRVDATKLLEGTVYVGEFVKGSKADVVCSHRGTCDELSGDCECFAAYTSSDANNSFGLREDCGVMLSSGWVAGK